MSVSPRVLRGPKVLQDIVTIIPVIFTGKDFGADLEDNFFSAPTNRPATFGPDLCMTMFLVVP